jgi:hypothetical protein
MVDAVHSRIRPEGGLAGIEMSRAQEITMGVGFLVLADGFVLLGLDLKSRTWSILTWTGVGGGAALLAGPSIYQLGLRGVWAWRYGDHYVGTAPSAARKPAGIEDTGGFCYGVSRQFAEPILANGDIRGAEILRIMGTQEGIRGVGQFQLAERQRNARDQQAGKSTGNLVSYDAVVAGIGQQDGVFLIQAWTGECHTVLLRMMPGHYDFADYDYYEGFSSRAELLTAFKSWMESRWPALFSAHALWYLERLDVAAPR